MEWEGSNTGPSWQDVSDLIRSVESLHGGECSVVLNAVEHKGSPALRVVVMFQPMKGQRLLTQTPVTVSGKYPGGGATTMCGALLSMLYQLDTRCGVELWGQAELPS